jgi:hypothetical protein
MRRGLRALILAVSLAVAQTGCGGPTLIVAQYSGPKRPAEEIAILRFYGTDQAMLVTIDGERADVRLDEDVRLHIEVLPGKHRAGVVPRDDLQGPLRWVSFEVGPGRVYRIVFARAASGGDVRARAFEVDAASDALIRDVTLPDPVER